MTEPNREEMNLDLDGMWACFDDELRLLGLFLWMRDAIDYLKGLNLKPDEDHIKRIQHKKS